MVFNHPQGTPKFTQLDYIDQRVNTRLWALATQPCRSLYCTVGGDPITMAMTLKMYLQQSSQLKEINTCKTAGSINWILKSNFQVLSLINQFKSNRFILWARIDYTNMMESYKFHYLRNFHHFCLLSRTKMILLLHYLLARSQVPLLLKRHRFE